ncbi:hypothetical protein [Saccharothrix algeriensis]|uniref:Orc1-like AAA ATPase domain-containing protein n=1 Tax=Saccharothrix algeriensis TaxID=173560 RepID=A0ABS2SA30_9PSEU|nr:hypothetical protein [Saccharothrix algeriensis]MBM7811931.1 hypothetical protein [Saccharothrix algeriensis]
MASRQVKINAVVVVLLGAAVGVVTNYASDETPEWFKDQPRVWLVFGVLVLLGVVVQLLASREVPERSAVAGGGRAGMWNVPGRNPHFTGRDGDLGELRRLLRSRSRVAVHAVRGMGGVGKTQLAQESCHRHGARLEVVWWINAENPALIPPSRQQAWPTRRGPFWSVPWPSARPRTARTTRSSPSAWATSPWC